MNVPILMYHEVIDAQDEPACEGRAHPMAETYYVKSGAFEQQLTFLHDSGFRTVSLASLEHQLNEPHRRRLPEKSIVLSFDDGYIGNYTHAFPLLKKYGFHAVFFVAVGKIGQPGMMDWPMLEEMSRSGMSVQSHTMSHPFLKQLSDAQVRTELLDSKRIIEQHLHTAVNFVSLPNGSYGDNYKSIAMACGYLGGCSSKIGYNNTATDGYLLRRILISSRFDINEFREIVLNKGFFEPFLALKQSALDMVRSFIGENLYMDIYRVIFGLR